MTQSHHFKIGSAIIRNECRLFLPTTTDAHDVMLCSRWAEKRLLSKGHSHHSGWASTTRLWQVSHCQMWRHVLAHTNTVASLDGFKTLTSTSHWIIILIDKKTPELQRASIVCGIPPRLMYCRLLCLSDWLTPPLILQADNKLTSTWCLCSVLMVGLSAVDANSSIS